MRSDEELMAAYVAGEAAAFQALFDRYAPVLLRMMQRDLGRREDARDLVQQTFLQLHRARADFRPGSRLRPWLMTIALNLKREYFRRRGRRPEGPLDLDGRSDPRAKGGDPERALAGQHLRAVLGELPAGQREVIELHWFSGLSFPEIAQVVGASHAAVKVRAHRGYERLRKLLGPETVTVKGETAYSERDA